MRRTRTAAWAAVLGLVMSAGVASASAGAAEGNGSAKGPNLELDDSFGTAGVVASPLSATETDRFLAVATDGKATFAAGFTTSGGDQAFTVTKFDGRGRPDSAFGTNGTATVNVTPGGKTVELVRGIVVQDDGKVVVTGPVEHDPKAVGDAARDTDIAVARFTKSGDLDSTFGTAGVARVDLTPGVAVNATTFRGDTSWGIAQVGKDTFVNAAIPTTTLGRTDTDLVVLKLDGSGEQDTAFGTAGLLTYDRGGSADSARGLVVQPDDKLIAGGYSADATGVVTPILVRFDAKGRLDKSFAEGGALPATKFLGSVSELYNVALQDSKLVFAGYGTDFPEQKVDLYTVRLTAKGARDNSYAGDGIARVDIAQDEDRGRNLVVTKNGLVVAVGSGKPDATNMNGLVAVFDTKGEPVAGFGTDGILLHDLGGPNDAFFGAATTEDGGVVIVGYKGFPTGGNDDAVVLRLAPRKA